MVHAPAKVFSVERRGQQIGAAAAVSSVPLPTSEIMDELRALRAEMAELRETVTDRLNGSGIDVLAERDQLSDDDAMKRDVRIEIAQMVRSIGRAKAEIAAIKHPEAGTDQMEVASHQLEAITATTEKSTNEIMTAVDDIESALKKITALTVEDGEVSPHIDYASERLIAIIEACSFQDITGQRVTQVVRTLRFIESRILAMIDIWGLEAFRDLPLPDEERSEEEVHEEAELLNGPALGGKGLSQDDIDALFD
ncbi:protein phosphatase CheZ [Thalassobaculum sp.]|uniref:protein phosphatase CheZ n=1 Tax=Thalassobaculum sp. TaxID=2022740 RepID=UPI0032ECBB23